MVDDLASNRALLERLLGPWGYTVQTAADGHAALESVAAEPPDLILLDVAMPGIDGITVCRQLKDSPATRLLPVILVTGLTDKASRVEGINAGADDFILKPFDADELFARVRSLLRVKRYTDDLESAESIIMSLALTIEARDPYTNDHCHRLARYATALGRALGLNTDDLVAIERGAYLHDVGKIAVPDAILQKPSALTPEEFRVLQQHAVIGERLCGNLRSLAPVRAIVRHHHERLDGSGYPDGLRGDQIPLLAQIVSIADTYDAITTVRPYRAARSHEQACEAVRLDVARGLFDEDLVETFISAVNSTAGLPGPVLRVEPRASAEVDAH